MTITVKYIGTVNPYFEVAVTGKPTKWTPGRTGEVGDTDGALLIATGLFEPYADQVLPFVLDASGAIVGARKNDGTVLQISGAGGSAYLGAVAATANLTALSGVLGSTAEVGSGSSAVTYELKTLPASVEANWQPLQGTIADGTAIVLTIVPGKTERQLLVWVAAATEVTVTDGTTTSILWPSTNPHVIPIYDEPGSASPASVSIQRTSGTATTGRYSLEG